MSANAKTLLNSRVFSLRQRWDSWHFALQMPRRALRAEPTCSCVARLLKRHCGDGNKHAYCHKTHLFSQSLTATPITAIKSNEIENQTIVPLNCRLGVIAITLVLLATNPISTGRIWKAKDIKNCTSITQIISDKSRSLVLNSKRTCCPKRSNLLK